MEALVSLALATQGLQMKAGKVALECREVPLEGEADTKVLSDQVIKAQEVMKDGRLAGEVVMGTTAGN
jgi:hypothetical protein